MIDQVVKGKFKSTGLDLFAEYHGQEAWIAVNGFVAVHGLDNKLLGWLVGANSAGGVHAVGEFLHNVNV